MSQGPIEDASYGRLLMTGSVLVMIALGSPFRGPLMYKDVNKL